MIKYFVFIIGFLCLQTSLAQNKKVADSLQVKVTDVQKQITWNTDPLSPARAAFYSAIFPGLGQIYNKSYWKVPLVYGALGTTIYFYMRNSKEFDRYQTAYKRRVAGFTDDEFFGDRGDGQPRLSTDGLRRAQQFYRRNKELSLLFLVGFYALNIVDANVDAHLKQFNVDENITLEPFLSTDDITSGVQYGLSLQIRF
ncbi:DUF5683 domain-containing protein [Capnocytophaga canimorsus]|uniref:DUF5683 domain-containing protein n=1 Tax=Capnocytophaga canimorsus TaxID=28188 RepID=UPI0037D15546